MPDTHRFTDPTGARTARFSRHRREGISYPLSKGRARVTEVAAPYPISLNSVSKHIRILERAGLVRRQVSGRDHFLSLDPKPLNEVAEWMARARLLVRPLRRTRSRAARRGRQTQRRRK